jgi:hypothetical protein
MGYLLSSCIGYYAQHSFGVTFRHLSRRFLQSMSRSGLVKERFSQRHVKERFT